MSRTFHAEGLTAAARLPATAFCTPADVEGLTLEVVRVHAEGRWTPCSRWTDDPAAALQRDDARPRPGGERRPPAAGWTPRRRPPRSRCGRRWCGRRASCWGSTTSSCSRRTRSSDGALGQYAVHLGSAGVHRLPGGALCIVAGALRSTAAGCSCRSRTTTRGPPRCSPRCCCSPGTGRSRIRTFWNGFARGRAGRS